ncbi:uncharacterized protein CEXT_674431 [Caerostris extrusa]|uniref:Uncharacterized protein n=1 Tax=Caerostris extrusa TaxID=172846 RepID=A0AAV4S628_CAEEX|nr:uncharacterized protein CEXT_674431 [Caerostris extrusa]
MAKNSVDRVTVAGVPSAKPMETLKGRNPINRHLNVLKGGTYVSKQRSPPFPELINRLELICIELGDFSSPLKFYGPYGSFVTIYWFIVTSARVWGPFLGFSHLPKSSPPILTSREENLSNRRLLKSTETVCFSCRRFNPFVTEHRTKKMAWLKGRRQAPGVGVEEREPKDANAAETYYGHLLYGKFVEDKYV